jgi:hypothetical protein
MATIIIIKHGYTHLAIPFSAARIAALADLMENSTPIDLGWSGEMSAIDPETAKELSFSVVSRDIPVYVPPTPVIETETNETLDGSED